MPTGTRQTDTYGSRSISIVQQARATETKDFTLEKIIGWIRSGSGRFAKNILAVREATEAGNLDRASDLKKNLPAVMFSGSFSRRSSKNLVTHSGMICMDVDKIDSPARKVDEMRFDRLHRCSVRLSFWQWSKIDFCNPRRREATQGIIRSCKALSFDVWSRSRRERQGRFASLLSVT